MKQIFVTKDRSGSINVLQIKSIFIEICIHSNHYFWMNMYKKRKSCIPEN